MGTAKEKLKGLLMGVRMRQQDDMIRKAARESLILTRRMKYMVHFVRNRVEEDLILVEAFQGKKYCDSPKAIYEKMLKLDETKKYRFVWAFRDKQGICLPDQERTQVVAYFSKEYYQTMAKAKYIITNSRLLPHIKTKKKQVVLQTWHGTPLKRLGCDIKVDYDNPYNTLKEVYDQYETEGKTMDYLVSPSAYASDKLASTFNLKKLNKQDCILETGYPRNDFLINYEEKDIKRVREELNLPTNKKVVLYAPTFRDNQHVNGVGYTFLPEINFDLLREKLTDDFIILFRAHYLVSKSFDFSRYAGFIYDVSGVEDINDLYIVSDMLVTDYSSVFFDFAILKRPMIFYMYDLDSYQNNLRGFYLELVELPGPIVKEENELIDCILQYESVSDKYKEQRDQFTERFNYLDDGKASDRVIESVFR